MEAPAPDSRADRGGCTLTLVRATPMRRPSSVEGEPSEPYSARYLALSVPNSQRSDTALLISAASGGGPTILVSGPWFLGHGFWHGFRDAQCSSSEGATNLCIFPRTRGVSSAKLAIGKLHTTRPPVGNATGSPVKIRANASRPGLCPTRSTRWASGAFRRTAAI